MPHSLEDWGRRCRESQDRSWDRRMVAHGRRRRSWAFYGALALLLILLAVALWMWLR